jgi:hypothetical protein
MRWTRIGLLAALTAVLLARLLEWWPCTIACAGGGAYERLAGVPVTIPALAGTVLALVLAWRSHPLLPVVLGLMAGASVFFLLVSVALGLMCPFCLTVHGLVLTVAATAWSWPRLPVALLIGLLGTNAGFHHTVLRDSEPPTPTPTATPPPAPLTAPEATGRIRGPVNALRTADLYLDLTCPHCAELRPRLLAALAEVRVTERLVVRRGEPAGRDLARWGVAAARRGPEAWDLYVRQLLGSRSGLTREELVTAHGDLLRPLDADPTANTVVDQDQALLRTLRFDGKTPFLVLRESNRILARASGAINLRDLATLPSPLPPSPSPAR